MKLQMKLEALAKLNRKANDKGVLAQEWPREGVLAQFWHSWSENRAGFDRDVPENSLFSEGFWSHPPGLNRRPADYKRGEFSGLLLECKSLNLKETAFA
jgi:hypothetical protein